MADAGTQYEFKSVTTVRGMEAKPTAKMLQEGWELVTQTPAPLLRTALTFRRPKQKLPKYALPIAGGAVLLLAIIITIGALTEGKTPEVATPPVQTDAATSAQPTQTPTPTPTPAASTSVVPTSVKPTVVVEPVQPASTTSSSKTTSDQVAALADKTLKEGLGVTSYTEVCGTVNWACPITGFTTDASGTMLTVSVQETLTSADAKKTALAVWNFIGEALPDLRWVIIRDATGTDRGQLQRSEVPLLR